MIALCVAHSSSSPGAVSSHIAGLSEYRVSQEATQACSVALSARGIANVVLDFRSMDQIQYLAKRVQAVNGMYPKAMVEIHLNSSGESEKANYSEAIHHPDSVSGKGLAHSIVNALGIGLGRSHHWPSKGARGERLYVTEHTHCPTVIVEGLFISNKEQAEFLADPLGKQAYGMLVAEGIAEWLKGDIS